MTHRLLTAVTFGGSRVRSVTEEEKRAAISTFYQSDLHNKGFLDNHDVKVAILALFGYKPAKLEIDRLLQNEVVTQKDGSTALGLSLDRFVTIMCSKLAARDEDEHIRQMFLAFDMQCRGFLTCEDLKKVFALTAPNLPAAGIEAAFRELDRDCDGRVSYKDFDFAMKYDPDNHF